MDQPTEEQTQQQHRGEQKERLHEEVEEIDPDANKPFRHPRIPRHTGSHGATAAHR